MTREPAAALLTALLAWVTPAPQTDTFTRAFAFARPGEVLVRIRAGCATCDWGATGREAVALRLSVDGVYSQHLVLSRGETPAEYRVRLGTFAGGRHELRIERDPALSAKAAGPASIDVAAIALVAEGGDAFTAQSMAPIVYARPNTVGTFTDLPLLMWYEVEPTPRGRQYRYSVIFSNEDGGTQTDRLMATWGRTTDIEFVYGVEVDAAGRILAEEFQGPGHEVPAFTGQHEARHPLLWVSTDNNMVSESGPTHIRYAPEALKFDLTHVSREAVMDANPWTYAIASVEMRREGKVVDDAPPGHDAIPDPRRFVFVEACGTIGNAALSLSIGSVRPGSARVRLPASAQTVGDGVRSGSVRLPASAQTVGDGVRSGSVRLPASAPTVGDGVRNGSVRLQPDRDLIWTPSDRGLPQYRIVRDGCFRVATPLPAGTRAADIRAIRVQAFDQPPAEGAAPAAADPVRLTRINKVFMLDERFLPGPSMVKWEGAATIRAGGDPFEVRIP